MNRQNLIPLITIFLLSSLLLIGTVITAGAQKQPVTAFVSILPMVDFVQKIAGNRIRVLPLVLPGQSPATYTPTPKQMTALAGADLYFRIGVPFENSLVSKMKSSRPKPTIIDLRNGIELTGEINNAPHSHNNEAHSHDPHIWLDPILVKRMTVTIRDSLTLLDPAGADTYQTNCTKFQTELDQLDQQLRHTLQPLAQKEIYVFHPAYAYFCRAYNLIQKPISPAGKTPGARYLARIIEQAGRDQVRFIFIQPQFSKKTAQAVARAIGATLIPLDPLAKDYLGNMATMGHSIANALHQNTTSR